MKLLDGLDVLNVWRGSVSGDIGFVPTMGALHQGHMDLIGRSIRDNQQTIVSIFVNPMQFGPGEDLAKYPRPVEKDEDICRSLGVTALYRPSVHALYPLGFSTKVEVEGVQDAWCGARRPGHFAGVATVILKLLNQISPRKLYLGQKDAQQVAVLKRIVLEPPETRMLPPLLMKLRSTPFEIFSRPVDVNCSTSPDDADITVFNPVTVLDRADARRRPGDRRQKSPARRPPEGVADAQPQARGVGR